MTASTKPTERSTPQPVSHANDRGQRPLSDSEGYAARDQGMIAERTRSNHEGNYEQSWLSATPEADSRLRPAYDRKGSIAPIRFLSLQSFDHLFMLADAAHP